MLPQLDTIAESACKKTQTEQCILLPASPNLLTPTPHLHRFMEDPDETSSWHSAFAEIKDAQLLDTKDTKPNKTARSRSLKRKRERKSRRAARPLQLNKMTTNLKMRNFRWRIRFSSHQTNIEKDRTTVCSSTKPLAKHCCSQRSDRAFVLLTRHASPVWSQSRAQRLAAARSENA